MLAVNQIICVLLMSCFDKELVSFDKCPQNCKCFSAPKDGYNWDKNSKSLICDNIKDLAENQLRQLEPINTLAVGIEGLSATDPTKDLTKTHFYINNLYFYGTQSLTQSTVNSISSLIGVNVNELQVLTMVNLNLDSFNWKDLIGFTELRAIHIEDCQLTEIDQNNFGALSSLKIISVSIIKSKLKVINANTFNSWNELKILSIVGNPLNEIHWLNTNLPKLWRLNLQDNYIFQIPDYFSNWLPKLKALNLDNNNLKFLYWVQISPLLTKLREFTFSGNTFCMNDDVKEFYKELDKFRGTHDLPEFFAYTTNHMFCKDISKYGPSNPRLPPNFLCKNYNSVGYQKDPQALEHCVNWPGDKS